MCLLCQRCCDGGSMLQLLVLVVLLLLCRVLQLPGRKFGHAACV